MLALIIGNRKVDPLIDAARERLLASGYQVCVIAPGRLALARVAVNSGEAFFEGGRIAAVLFRAAPAENFGCGFAAEDVSFAAAEARALWVHILSLPSIAAMNRADCDTWFVPSPWLVWQRRLESAGVPTSRCTFGVPSTGARTWLQWSGGFAREPAPEAVRALGAATIDAQPLREFLWVSRSGNAESTPHLAAAGRVLETFGVRLASFYLDPDDAIAAVSTFPRVPGHLATDTAIRIVEAFDGHRADR